MGTWSYVYPHSGSKLRLRLIDLDASSCCYSSAFASPALPCPAKQTVVGVCFVATKRRGLRSASHCCHLSESRLTSWLTDWRACRTTYDRRRTTDCDYDYCSSTHDNEVQPARHCLAAHCICAHTSWGWGCGTDCACDCGCGSGSQPDRWVVGKTTHAVAKGTKTVTKKQQQQKKINKKKETEAATKATTRPGQTVLTEGDSEAL